MTARKSKSSISSAHERHSMGRFGMTAFNYEQSLASQVSAVSSSLPRPFQLVRSRLVEDTQVAHNALHMDPVLSGLVSAKLSPERYYNALRVFLDFYQTIEIERRRHGLWPCYRLASTVSALRNDLSMAIPNELPLCLADHKEVLGALYVGHGAAFGRNIIRRNVKKTLAEANIQFLEQMPDPLVWQNLCNDLEAQGASPEGYAALWKGAVKAFSLIGYLAKAAAMRQCAE